MGRNLKPLDQRSTNIFNFQYPLADPMYYGIMEKAYKIIKRESITFDKLCTQAIEEYVGRHFDGNYQTLLASYEIDGIKSEGQQEQEIIRHFESRHKDGYKIKYIDITSRLREALTYSGTKLVNTAQRIAKDLHEKGMEVVF
jgi:hypothetical protein